ncbi:MAG: extensin family protein [Xanthobacteraceae bacterium]|nr:MAG: extensin family protein [Xanthobacteraceae bacterium]
MQDRNTIRRLGALAALVALLAPQAAAAAETVPLPRPRPPEAPALSETAPREVAPPSACRLALTEAIAIAPSVPPISGPGACGGDDLVRLEAVVLEGGGKVALKPPAMLRCTMASALAHFVRGDLASLAARSGSALQEIDNFDSYDCRGRNRVFGAQLSEHGRANAIDIRGVRLANGQVFGFTDRRLGRELREAVRGMVCARFATVLGPGSDWYHEDHVHLDLAERRANMKLCRWEVWDALPDIAPLMPAPRPAGAPPRAEEDGGDDGQEEPRE